MGAQELRNALQDADEVDLITTGRKSGQESTRPVWFVEEDEKLLLVPVSGTESDWYRNIEKTPTIGLAAEAPSSAETRRRRTIPPPSTTPQKPSARSTAPTG